MKLIDLALAAVCAAALGVTGYMLADSWGGASWVLDTVSGAAVTLLVLLRGRWSLAPAAAVAVAVVAAVVARVSDQPQAPGPAAALALSALVAWAVPRAAWWIVAGALTVVAATWATALPDDNGFTAVTVINVAGWMLGAAAGLVVRVQR